MTNFSNTWGVLRVYLKILWFLPVLKFVMYLFVGLWGSISRTGKFGRLVASVSQFLREKFGGQFYDDQVGQFKCNTVMGRRID